jgi:hypothetical protein
MVLGSHCDPCQHHSYTKRFVKQLSEILLLEA